MKKTVILVVGFFAYTYSRAVRIVPTNFMEVIADWGIAIGVIIAIVAALSSKKLSGFLNHKMLVFNGSLSYSCYLYHCTVLLAMFHIFSNSWHAILIYIASIPLIFLVSYLSWRYVEKPSITLGRRITKRMEARKKNTTELSKVN